MKLKLITFVAIILAGVLVTVSVVSGQMKTAGDYNGYLAVARKNAEREIPYIAYKNYKSAMEIQGGDEAVFLEYLSQAKLLGEDRYYAAVQEYVTLFPESANAYELYCGALYERASYKTLIDNALIAREKGIATEAVKNWYIECSYMLKGVMSGFDEVQSFAGAYARVKVGDLYGFVNTNGNFLIAPAYQKATMFLDCAAVDDGNEWHLINQMGYKVARTDTPADSLGALSGGKISASKDGKYGYTNASLVLPKEFPYEYASTFRGGVAAVKKGGKWALINTSEETITGFDFEEIVLDEFDTCMNGGVAFCKQNGKYYMYNAEGKKISDTGFEAVYPFASNQPAAVCVGGKWGFVDNTGKMVIEPAYENAKSFSLGLGAVCVDGQWGYISTGNVIRIEPQFEDCLPFSATGIAGVKVNGRWQYQQLLPYYY
jgi:hypothetical protein